MPVSSPADVLKILKIISILQYNDGNGTVVSVGYALYDTDRLRGPPFLQFFFYSYRGNFP
jgi:hypothetical protein